MAHSASAMTTTAGAGPGTAEADTTSTPAPGYGVSKRWVWAFRVEVPLSVLTAVYGVLAVIEFGLISRFVRRGITTGDGAPTPPGTPGGGAEPDRAADDDVLSFAY